MCKYIFYWKNEDMSLKLKSETYYKNHKKN